MTEHLKESWLLRFVRKVPPIKGKQRLAHFLFRKYLSRTEITLKDNFGFQIKVPHLGEPLAFSLLVDGIYEPALLNLLFHYLKPGDTFLDVGANVGCFTLPCAKHVGPSGNVMAIEASSKIFLYLKENVAASGLKNIYLEECAASSLDLEKNHFYEAPLDKFGMGSFGPQFNVSPVELTCRSLDSLLKDRNISKVNAIKIDVEGYESKVFEGAAKLLMSPDAPLIAFEFADWAEERLDFKLGRAQSVLYDFGYKIWRLEDFLKKRHPLKAPLTKGFYTLVASKGDRR
jgi:FkbM family methyltransferase